MKGQIWRRLRKAPVLYWSDILLTVFPALAWYAAVHSRPSIIDLRCAKEPSGCLGENVFFPDQVSLGLQSPIADGWSFTTQNLSGYLAAGVPVIWLLGLALSGRIRPLAALAGIATDLVIFAQASFWNGLITESVRLIAQRPRPFVYGNPAHLGGDPAHYTSFISGHTSFSAVAGGTLFFALVGRGAPRPLLIAGGASVMTLIFLTGLFRVLAGRHFVTDVLGGALAGVTVALCVSYVHRPRGPRIAS